MSETIELLNFLLASGGVLLLLGAVILIYDYYTTRTLGRFVKVWGISTAFLLTAAGSCMTLLYSEVFGFIPCGLCWLQRVFLYPQALLLGTSLWIRNTTVVIYGIVLSVPGLIIALYQHYLQMGGASVGCPAAGAGADCAKRILFEFGFMTFPLMSAALFAFLIVLYWYYYKIVIAV